MALPDLYFGDFSIHDWNIRKVFYWYDGPILYTASYKHLSMGILYMVGQAIDMDSHMVAVLSYPQCMNVENGVTTIRQAMKFPKGPDFVFAPFIDIRIHTKYALVGNLDNVETWNPLFLEDIEEKDWLFKGGHKWDRYYVRKSHDLSGRNVKSRKRLKLLAKRG